MALDLRTFLNLYTFKFNGNDMMVEVYVYIYVFYWIGIYWAFVSGNP